MIPFDYLRPKTLAGALSILFEHQDDAQILAGGHTLLPLMKVRMASTDLLVDIQDLPELKGIEVHEEHIIIGALTRHVDLQKSAALQREYPIFREAADQIADQQVRNRGTIGGSICAADPSADWPAIALMLKAQFVLESNTNERTIDATDYFLGMMETDRKPTEILTAVLIPRNSNGLKTSYQKFRHPASGYAVASVAAGLVLSGGKIQEARIAVSGVGDHVYLAEKSAELLLNQKPSEELFNEVAQEVTYSQNVMSDHFADAPYRTQLAITMCRRALETCYALV